MALLPLGVAGPLAGPSGSFDVPLGVPVAPPEIPGLVTSAEPVCRSFVLHPATNINPAATIITFFMALHSCRHRRLNNGVCAPRGKNTMQPCAMGELNKESEHQQHFRPPRLVLLLRFLKEPAIRTRILGVSK